MSLKFLFLGKISPMSHHEEHPQESPKRVYFGIPIAFALSFWFIVFLSLKACDGPSGCSKEECCSKECMEKCKKEGKDCKKECAKAEEGKNCSAECEKTCPGMAEGKGCSEECMKKCKEEGKDCSAECGKGKEAKAEGAAEEKKEGAAEEKKEEEHH
jgi:hypothetical protein